LDQIHKTKLVQSLILVNLEDKYSLVETILPW